MFYINQRNSKEDKSIQEYQVILFSSTKGRLIKNYFSHFSKGDETQVDHTFDGDTYTGVYSRAEITASKFAELIDNSDRTIEGGLMNHIFSLVMYEDLTPNKGLKLMEELSWSNNEHHDDIINSYL